MRCPPYTERAGTRGRKILGGRNVLAPVAAAARAAPTGCRSERVAGRTQAEGAPGHWREVAGEALFSGRGNVRGEFRPERKAEKEKLSGLRGEREDRELGKAARLRPREEGDGAGAVIGGGWAAV